MRDDGWRMEGGGWRVVGWRGELPGWSSCGKLVGRGDIRETGGLGERWEDKGGSEWSRKGN